MPRILVVKTLIWSLSLGSGTSGGVLAFVYDLGIQDFLKARRGP